MLVATCSSDAWSSASSTRSTQLWWICQPLHQIERLARAGSSPVRGQQLEHRAIVFEYGAFDN